MEELIFKSIESISTLGPFVIVIALGVMLFKTWLEYARRKFLSEQEYTLLRIYPPKEVTKSPAAMELFINALYQTGGEANNVDIYWYGKSRPWFSLEIASHGGEVAFYIWGRSALKGMIETQIYAQYPGIEVTEVDDYVGDVDYHSGKYEMFGLEYKLAEPDPIPIKTYVDYGLDRSTEEEEKIDPITPTLEFFGSLKAGEHAWLQIIVKAHKKEDHKRGSLFGKTDYWVDESKELIQKIREESFIEMPGSTHGPTSVMTEGQKDKIKAIERNVTKPGFDCGIRAIYIAEKDAFVGINIPGLIGTFKQYNSSNLNGFKPHNFTNLDFWWQDPTRKRVPRRRANMYNAYKDRVYFNTVFDKKRRNKFVLNSEELATIFHFPGGVAGTPTLTRVTSRKGDAPSNLPI